MPLSEAARTGRSRASARYLNARSSANMASFTQKASLPHSLPPGSMGNARLSELASETIGVKKETHRLKSFLVSKSVSIDSAPPPNDHVSSCVVQHRLFRGGINVVIILGIIQMGLEIEFSGPEFKLACQIWDIFYTVISTVEMLLMIEAFRQKYFQSHWLLLDFVLAIASIFDTIILPATHFAQGLEEYVSLLRLLRVLRILKVTKVFPGFAVIVEGLLKSFQSMIWIFGLLFLILYAGSICCVTKLGGPDAGFPSYNEVSVKAITIDGFNNYEHFGTLFRSMMTLLSMLLLSEWPVVKKIAEVHIGMVPLFLFLLVLVSFGIFNVIIGIVVEKTTEAMNAISDKDIERELGLKTDLSEELVNLLYNIDADHDESVDLDELEAGLQNPELSTKLNNLDLPYNFTVPEFLNMLDLDGNGKLSKTEFTAGLVRLIWSNDWQRQCLHAMQFGMLHTTMITLGKDLKAELRKSVLELKSEIRSLTHSNTVKVLPDDSEQRQDGTSYDVDAQSSTALWEPLPKAVNLSVPETELVPPIIHVGQENGAKHVPSFAAKISAPAPLSPEQVPLSETRIRPQVRSSSGQVPPSDTSFIRQAPFALRDGNSDSLDSRTHEGDHDVMAAPGVKTQTGRCGEVGLNDCSEVKRRLNWI